jgi:hypothetical protein
MLLFTPPMLRDMITNAFILLYFFLNYFIFIPQLYFAKKYWIYGFCIGFGFLCIALLPAAIVDHIPWQMDGPRHAFHGPPSGPHPPWPPDDHPGQPDIHPGPSHDQTGPLHDQTGPPDDRLGPHSPYSILQEISHSVYLYLAVILFSLLLRVRSRLFQVQEEKIIAELSSFRSQIKPHFLFNTLNSIYALAVKKDDKTADAVINLAGLMRYMIKDADGERISLQKELDYLTNYVELQKTRVRNTAAILFDIKGRVDGLEIAPLILITFVENAFKYGINPEMESKILIAIDVVDDQLALTVSNRKVLISNIDLSTGIGLHNTKNRLELIYYKEHRLDITEDNEHYTVNLSIHLI